MKPFCIFNNIEINKKKISKTVNTLENIMENRAFAQKEQRLHFPLYFQIHCISKSSKDVIM